MMRGMLLLGIVLLLIPAVCQATIGTELDGLASFGASAGLMHWVAGGDADAYGAGAVQPGPTGRAVFRYRFSTNWLGSFEAGYGWNGYAESDDLTLVVIPITIGVERRVRNLWTLTASVAGGAGMYYWGLRREGRFVRDAETQNRIHAMDPGFYVGGSGEFHVSAHVTSTVTAAVHYVFYTHGDEYRSAIAKDKALAEVRIGLNYYFSPYEGLIWGGGDGGE